MPKKKHVGPGNDNPDEKPIEGLQLSGEEIRERLLEAGSEEELSDIRKTLELEGVNPSSVRTQVLRLKKKGKLIFQTALIEGPTRELPVEAIIHDLKLPTIADGNREVFDAGVGYATRMIIGGVRIAQELSRMGIAQASPIIRMAAQLDQSKTKSAAEAGRAAAEEVAGGVVAYLTEHKPDIATVPNPMQGMVARMMENMFGRMFGMGQPGQQGGQGFISLPPGWTVGQGEEKSSE